MAYKSISREFAQGRQTRDFHIIWYTLFKIPIPVNAWGIYIIRCARSRRRLSFYSETGSLPKIK